MTTTEIEFRARFAANFNRLLDRAGVPANGKGRTTWIALRFECTRSTASKWVSGGGLPDLHRLPEIAEALNASMDELLGAKLDVSQNATKSDNQVIDVAIQLSKDGPMSLHLSPAVMRDYGLPDGVRLMKVSGDEMEPFLAQGELAFYVPVSQFRHPGVYVLRTPNDQLKLRRVMQDLTGGYLFTPENKRYPNEEYAKDWVVFGDHRLTGKVNVVGQVVGRLLWKR